MRLIFLLLCFLLVSCEKPYQTIAKTSNPDFKVGLLFEIDGIKVYRFWDGGRFKYFTSQGRIMSEERRAGSKTHYEDGDVP